MDKTMMKKLFILAAVALLLQPVGCTKPDPIPDDDQEQTTPEPEQPEEPQEPEDPKEPEQPEEEVDPRAPILKINALTSTKACIRIDYSF